VFLKTRHIHLVAIGGIGMSGIAEILLNLGFTVSGSDLHDTAATRRLAELGATIHIGHRETQIGGADVVVYSSAVTAANPEIVAARRRGVPVIRRAEMLAELMRMKHGIAVAGSHGKTTTTALTAQVLAAGGLDPTILIGGRALATGRNAQLGGGEYLVAEADESDGSFLRLTPTLAVVTNIDLEHVDHYADLPELRAAFVEFLDRVPFYGTCVLCADDPELRGLIPAIERRTVTYALDGEADIRGRVADDGATRARVEVDGVEQGEIRLHVPGRHNLQNALAAVAVGLELGLDFPTIAEALAAFSGVGRRYEDRGEHDGVLVVDDYGHHPTELAATLRVARASGRPVAALFQPHRYSRTQRFRAEFADVLASADRVGLLPVYAASEAPLPGVDSGVIEAAMRRKGLSDVTLLGGPEDLPAWLDDVVRPGDLLLTLGAGDIGRMVADVCEHLDRRAER